MVIPLLLHCDITGKDITGDALLTQRSLASYLVEKRQAHYHFTVKGNQPTLQQEIALLFADRGAATLSISHRPVITVNLFSAASRHCGR